MTNEVKEPVPVDTSHRDPAFAAQAPEETASTTPEQDAPEQEPKSEEGEQNESEQSAATENEGDEAAKPKPRGVQKRLDELTKARHEAERNAEHWRQMAMRREEAQQPSNQSPSATQDHEPTLEDHDYDVAAFTKAWSKWDRKQESIAAEREKAQQAVIERQQKYQASAAEFSAQHPDYMQVVNNPLLPMTQDMVDALTETDSPAAVAYYLAKNPQEAERIAGLSVAGIGRAIGKIESQLSSETPSQPVRKTVSNAPPPPTTLTGSNRHTPRLEEMSMAEYDAHRRKEREAKGLRS